MFVFLCMQIAHLSVSPKSLTITKANRRTNLKDYVVLPHLILSYLFSYKIERLKQCKLALEFDLE